MLYYFKIFILFITVTCSTFCFAVSQVKQLRVWAEPEKTRIVFDISEPIDYRMTTLQNPNGIALDLPRTGWQAKIDKSKLKSSGIQNFNYVQKNGILRVVLEMPHAFQSTAFLLKPNETYGHRLVLDLAPDATISPITPVATIQPMPIVKGQREFIIALDAGHGGEDPGAVGRKYKTYEKDIVLSVARKLQAAINRHPDMQAVLLRQSDYFVNLRERVKLARRFGADMFISLHADSFKDPKAKGASVFVLSEHGASSEAARWIAEKENRSDLIGGVKLDNKSNVLASVLLDLSQTATQLGSEELAQKVVGSLGRVTGLHHRSVQRAGFVVLKSPDIPSVLVELGFLSHPQGEADLKNPRHQQVLAQAIKQGIENYIKTRAKPIMEPQSAWLKRQRYWVKSGDTLASIASRHGVSVDKLSQMNSLSETGLKSGQKIIIPFKLDA